MAFLMYGDLTSYHPWAVLVYREQGQSPTVTAEQLRWELVRLTTSTGSSNTFVQPESFAVSESFFENYLKDPQPNIITNLFNQSFKDYGDITSKNLVGRPASLAAERPARLRIPALRAPAEKLPEPSGSQVQKATITKLKNEIKILKENIKEAKKKEIQKLRRHRCPEIQNLKASAQPAPKSAPAPLPTVIFQASAAQPVQGESHIPMSAATALMEGITNFSAGALKNMCDVFKVQTTT